MLRCCWVAILLSSLLFGETPFVHSIPFFENFGFGTSSIQGIATDSQGNVYVTGTTSGGIPIVNAVQPMPGGGNCSSEPNHRFLQCPNVFVAKFDATGTKLLYSTYLSGNQSDYAAGIAVDSAGNAYVTGTTIPALFNPSVTTPIGSVFVKKLSADGSALLYSRSIQGTAAVKSIAVDSKGNAHVAGFTEGAFAGVNPLPNQPAPVKSLYVTNDAGKTWRPLNHGINATNVNALAIDPADPAILYAATSAGLYRSLNAGGSWSRLLPDVQVIDFVKIDPRRRATLYVSYNGGLARSSDGGASFVRLDQNFPPPAVPGPSAGLTSLVIDPANSNVLWALTNARGFSTVIRSLDSGDHWELVYRFPSDIFTTATLNGKSLLLDSKNPSRLYACCIHDPRSGTGGVYRSDDNGKTWTQGAVGPLSGASGITAPWLDPGDGNVLYGSFYSGLQRSADGGMSWNEVALPTGLTTYPYDPSGLALDASGTLYLLNDTGFLLSSHDRGATWTKVTGPWVPRASILAIDPTNSSTWYVASGASLGTGGVPAQHAFVAKLDSSGTIQWATPLGGSGQDVARALALDPQGNVYVTGQTYSTDFPTLNPFQAELGRNSGFSTANAFVSKINADGSRLLYSSYLGGSGRDSGNAIAVDASGTAYVAGGALYDLTFPIVGLPQYRPAVASAASFLSVVDPTGGRLIHSSFLTGSEAYPVADQANAIALDLQGRIVVGGVTADFAMPMVNPVQPTFGLGSNFIQRVDKTSFAVDFSTYFGDLRQDLLSLALAANGNLWIGEAAKVVGMDFEVPATATGVPLVLSVASGASFVGGDVVAPGEIVTLFGKELAPAAESAVSDSLPRAMQGVSVTIGGIAAPLFYVSATQINLQVPFEVPLGSAPLRVQRGLQASALRTLTVVATSPGIFTTAGGQPAVVHAADFSLVTTQNPARPGEYLAVFATGLGATNPASVSGEKAKAAATLVTQLAYGVFSSGPSMQLAYIGIAPGFVGLYQINFQVSPTEQAGMKHLYFQVGSNYTNQVAVPVGDR